MYTGRKIAFTIVAAIMSLITLWIAVGYCSVVTKPLINTGDVNNIKIDGADFTFLFKLGAFAFNGIVTAAFAVIMMILELILMPLTWGLFRHFAFKANPASDAGEVSYSLRVFVICACGTLAVALVVMIVCAVRAKSAAPFAAVMFCGLNPLFMHLLYLSKLKKGS